VVLATVLRRRVLKVLRDFFTASAHPLNLALFRVVVFWRIFRQVDIPTILAFSRMPSALQFPPWGAGTILRYVPINEHLATIAAVLTLVFSVTGMVGLFSRGSALLCLIFGFYALGIPEFYGKVDHYNHVLWFVALLSVSPCGDVLGLDALFAARKRADRGITDPPAPSRQHALPLRFAMLLLGLIYFFPGFWKLWESGFGWVSGANLEYQLHVFWTWSYNGAWLPAFRIDHNPLLCTLGAAGTVIFELSFLFLIFSPKLRMLAVAGGVLFHDMTRRFMQIGFMSLQQSYVVFFDWARIFRAVGRRLYGSEMFFLYDGQCRMCRRTVASLRVFDVFRRVTYLNSGDDRALGDAGLSWVDRDQARAHVSAVTGNRVQAGFAAYRALTRRIPFLWPALPLLYIRPINRLGDFIYRRVESSRQRCEPDRSAIGRLEPGGDGLRLAGSIAVCTLVVLGCLVSGANKIVSGWPFACYPTFSSPPRTQIESLGMVAETASGESIPVNITAIPHHRLFGLLANILQTGDPALRRERLQALWTFAARSDPKLRRATSVKFYRQTLWIDPELWKRNPADRQLLARMRLASPPMTRPARRPGEMALSVRPRGDLSGRGPVSVP